LIQNDANGVGLKPDHANDGLISWLRANPGPALSASAAALGIIVAIAAIIAVDNLAGKVIGGILFSLVAVMIFVANWLWGHTNGKQMSVSILSAVALEPGQTRPMPTRVQTMCSFGVVLH
jgi:hypothetical protein